MDWISELDKYGYNHLIDELVWHLEQGRVPEAVRLINCAERSGFEFSFPDIQPAFLTVQPEWLNESWEEAKQIADRFSQLQAMHFVTS